MLILGTQAISFAALSRKFAAIHGLMPASRFSELLNAMTLERLLLLAAVLFFAGFGGLLACIWQWAAIGFGPLEYSGMLRELILSMTSLAMGVQLAFSAFLSSIVEIPTK